MCEWVLTLSTAEEREMLVWDLPSSTLGKAVEPLPDLEEVDVDLSRTTDFQAEVGLDFFFLFLGGGRGMGRPRHSDPG